MPPSSVLFFLPFKMISTSDSMYSEYIAYKQDRVAEFEQEMEPYRTQIAALNKIIADEAAKEPVQAWKRKTTAPVVKRESQASLDAKASIDEIQSKLDVLVAKATKHRTAIADLEKTLAENQEFREWSENLRLPISQRRNLPIPAVVARQTQREAEERAESMTNGEWVSLTLDHRSPKGKSAREAFYIKMDSPDEFGVVIDTPKKVVEETIVEMPIVQEPVEQVKRRRAWWYTKYNIPLEA